MQSIVLYCNIGIQKKIEFDENNFLEKINAQEDVFTFVSPSQLMCITPLHGSDIPFVCKVLFALTQIKAVLLKRVYKNETKY